MAFKQFGSNLINSRKDSPLKVAHSRYKLEINLVLTSVYKTTVTHHVKDEPKTCVFQKILILSEFAA
jgi:hypothetical protein